MTRSEPRYLVLALVLLALACAAAVATLGLAVWESRAAYTQVMPALTPGALSGFAAGP